MLKLLHGLYDNIVTVDIKALLHEQYGNIFTVNIKVIARTIRRRNAISRSFLENEKADVL